MIPNQGIRTLGLFRSPAAKETAEQNYHTDFLWLINGAKQRARITALNKKDLSNTPIFNTDQENTWTKTSLKNYCQRMTVTVCKQQLKSDLMIILNH